MDDWNAPTGTDGVKLFKASMLTYDTYGYTVLIFNDYYLKGTADSIYLDYKYNLFTSGEEESPIIQQA